MASAFYNIAKARLGDGTIDWDNDTINVALLMNNTSADTDIDADDVADIGTLDESDDTGSYSRISLSNATATANDTDDRGEYDADDISFTGLNGDATRDYQGILVYKVVTDDTDSIPIAFIDFPSDVSSSATQVDVSFDSAGLFYFS